MKKEWILDLLADVRECAVKNAMFSLAEQLEDSIMIAAAEIREVSADGLTSVSDDFGENRSVLGHATDSDIAG